MIPLTIESTAELLAYLDDGYTLTTTVNGRSHVWRYNGYTTRRVPVLPQLIDGNLIAKLNRVGRNDWALS